MPTDTLARLQLPKRAFAIVLAGGRGARLGWCHRHHARYAAAAWPRFVNYNIATKPLRNTFADPL